PGIIAAVTALVTAITGLIVALNQKLPNSELNPSSPTPAEKPTPIKVNSNATPTSPPTLDLPTPVPTEPPDPCESMAPAVANQRIQAARSVIGGLGHDPQTLQVYLKTANEPCFYRADRPEILNFLAQWC